MLPPTFTSRQALDAAIELGKFRDDLDNVVHQAGRYLATLPECPLKAEHALIHAELLALQERARATIENGKQALVPLFSAPATQG